MEFTKIKFGGRHIYFNICLTEAVIPPPRSCSYGGCTADTPLEGQIAGQGSIKSSKNGVFIKLIFEVLNFHKDAKLSFKKKVVFLKKKCTFS